MKRVGRLRELTTNATLLLTTAGGHLGEDPLTFLLQTTRRLPRRLAGTLARAAGGLGPADGLAAAYAAWLGGRPAAAAHLLDGVAVRAPRGVRRRLLAELALQVGRADLLPDLPGPAWAVLRSRAAWAAGDTAGALAVLQEGGGLNGRRLAVRYRSEADLMEPGSHLAVPAGATRRGHPARAATGERLSAFHVLTNSLPHTQSGYALRSHAVLEAQAGAGVRVAAATRIGYPVSVGILGARHKDVVDEVRYHRVLPARMPATARDRLQRQADLLAPVVARHAPDVLHTTTNYLNGLVTLALAEGAGIPWVYEVRGLLEETWVAGHPTAQAQQVAAGSARYAALRARETETMLAADHVVTLSTTLRSELVSRGVPRDGITVVPNAVDPALLTSNLPAADARGAVGLGRSGFWVGTVSSLVEYEGLETLIDAIALLRSRGVDARGCIVGDGVSRSRLERRASTQGVGAHVVFTGRVPRHQAALYHQALDVFAVPRRDVRVSRLVTPLKPIEAMACRRPVVASDLPALAEIVAAPGSGVLAPAGDPVAWADALEGLAAQPELRQTLGEAGREFAAGRTWGQAGAAYRSLYAQMVAR